MGFKKVYKALLEIFPEVDSRALRAVAIEHQKDADAAVEVVLTEVIPFLTERSIISSSSSKNRTIAQPPKVTTDFANGPSSSSNDVLVDSVKCQEEEQHAPFYDTKDEHQTFHDANDGLHELDRETRSDNATHECDEISVTVGSVIDPTSCISSAVLIHENGANAGPDKLSGDHSFEETLYEVSEESSAGNGCDQVSQLHLKPLEHGNVHSQELDDCLDSESIRTENFEKKNVLFNDGDNFAPLIFEPLDIQICDLNKEPEVPVDTALNNDASIEMVDVEDDSVLNTVVTRSGQICSIDLLADIIADARNNKKTLLSAVELVLGLMKEVEAQEKAAEKAKEDAANGGLDILMRVEELKQMLQHAKEANDMHAGEVYGERAILATEVRELHSRLLCMSEERDRSLKLFDEMRQILEERLVAAENEIKAAEKQKLERKDVSRKALKHQETIMEKVVQEANLLKQEAEANAKLREFLMDRGRVVDTLQGEISVICKDMRLLKERFDERLPLSMSLTSSQRGCILASSYSSTSRSVTSDERVDDQVSDLVDVVSEACGKIDLKPFLNEPNFMEVEKTTEDNKDLGEDGWEIFDNREAYM